MKHSYFILLWCWLGLSACHTTKEVVTVREAVHDTLYREAVRYDSIYIDRWKSVEARHDTIFCDQVRTEYRWRYLHDTTYVARRDTVPVVTYIDRPTPYVPRFVKVLAWLGAGSIILLIITLRRRVTSGVLNFFSQRISRI